MEGMFFGGWPALLRVLIVGVCAYAALIVILRVSGKRTLSKMNAFDLVVTVALGSTLATVLLNRSVSLAEGAVAFGVLAGLQYLVAWAGVRAGWVRRLVTGEPTLLLHRGEPLPGALRRERVREEEVLAAVRSSGLGGLGDAEAVVLETDGSFSVIPQGESAGRSTLADVHGPGPGPSEQSGPESGGPEPG